jgi:hypothetical protein
MANLTRNLGGQFQLEFGGQFEPKLMVNLEWKVLVNLTVFSNNRCFIKIKEKDSFKQSLNELNNCLFLIN